ncbi:MAG TPA: ABC transporter substrate-binding protein [Terriglobales bacterium]|jgi:ABC transporter substrate binding protein (PQQ-dependent alcohol dehydrogenase system)|nr:ABC transporter substrate-binding protein [Terriglobales bacterium]
MGESVNKRSCAIARSAALLWAALAVQLAIVPPASGQPQAPPEQAHGDARRMAIVLARQLRDPPPPLSLLDFAPQDDGVAGARLAVNDNNTTGRFLKQEFTLDVVQSVAAPELIAEVVKRVDAGAGFVVADASGDTVRALADALKGRDALVMNAGSFDDRLREADCRMNVLHTAPSRTMLADGLAQYLGWRHWRRWFLVRGAGSDDEAFAEALRRAAKRFGGKIVEERTFKVETGSRRADGGHEQIQQQIPAFTQNAPSYDVLLVADEGGQFGEYFPYRTWDPRPVAGTQGLVPMSWHPALEQWGATQFQNRFRRLANRPMRPLDYDMWVAVRSIGEAATRTKSVTPKVVIQYLKSPDFDLAAFKGRKLSYRNWNGQLRQPILVGTAKLPVTVSPQPGFLHQFSELDTLGIDRPESTCRAYEAVGNRQ